MIKVLPKKLKAASQSANIQTGSLGFMTLDKKIKETNVHISVKEELESKKQFQSHLCQYVKAFALGCRAVKCTFFLHSYC